MTRFVATLVSCGLLLGCVIEPPRPLDANGGGGQGQGAAPATGAGDPGGAEAGQALDFTGGADRIVASDAGLPSGAAPRTVEAWVRTSASGGEQYYVAYGTLATEQGFYLGILNGQLVVTQIGQSVSGATPIADGAWHHLAVVFDSGGYELYVDGALDGSGNLGTNTVLGGLVVGSTVSGENKPAVATIDEVRIWDRARTQGEIQAAMASPLSGSESGLLIYYDLDLAGQGAGVLVPNRGTLGALLDGTTEGSATTPSFVPSDAF